MSDNGSLADASSTTGRLRLRKEKVGFRAAGKGEGNGGGEEGAEESSDSSCGASDENKARSAAGGLEGADADEDAGALAVTTSE